MKLEDVINYIEPRAVEPPGINGFTIEGNHMAMVL